MTFSLATLLFLGPRNRGQPVERTAQGEDVKIALRDVNVFYGDRRALKDVYLDLYRDSVNALVGPSGGGKSTLLRCLNRFIDTVPRARVEGVIAIDGRNVLARSQEITRLRRRFGVVAQTPNPFPRSVYDNVSYGPRIHRLAQDKATLDRLVRQSLERAGLWSEVANDLDARATELSVGQQQRLCIARALAYDPEIILLDEPCAGLDPVSAAQIEDLILALGQQRTLVVATHSLTRAARIARYTAFFHDGRLVEHAPTDELLAKPKQPETRSFIEGGPTFARDAPRD